MSAQQYPALYAVILNTYGGNTQSFNLPDLQGMVPVGMGSAPGLSPWNLGNKGGTETVALTTNQMPGHTHTAYAESDSATTSNPAGNIVAAVKSGTPGTPKFYKDNPQTPNLVVMGASRISVAGTGTAHENRQPYQVFNFCINYDGTFPPKP